MQKDRKKEHKKIVKAMRNLNNQLLHDDYVGCGRFRVDIYREDMYRYQDNSGVNLTIFFKLSDKLTGNEAIIRINDSEYKLWSYMNDFMIKSSSGHDGHYPPLNYIECNIKQVIPYSRE